MTFARISDHAFEGSTEACDVAARGQIIDAFDDIEYDSYEDNIYARINGEWMPMLASEIDYLEAV